MKYHEKAAKKSEKIISENNENHGKRKIMAWRSENINGRWCVYERRGVGAGGGIQQHGERRHGESAANMARRCGGIATAWRAHGFMVVKTAAGDINRSAAPLIFRC